MKYSEATKLIKGLSKEYSINNDELIFVLIYKSKPIAWVDKREQFNFGSVNISASGFDKLPYSHKLWMILAELAMTPISEREEHKWNVIIGNDDAGMLSIIAWQKDFTGHGYRLSLNDSDTTITSC